MERRIVGIDLGIASEHTVRVLTGDGATLAKRKAVPTVESLGGIEQTALADAPEGTRLEVVMEPTGPAWLPIAVFFASRGHLVFRVSSQKAADLLGISVTLIHALYIGAPDLFQIVSHRLCRLLRCPAQVSRPSADHNLLGDRAECEPRVRGADDRCAIE
mgnify:CR=1 FL=1